MTDFHGDEEKKEKKMFEKKIKWPTQKNWDFFMKISGNLNGVYKNRVHGKLKWIHATLHS